MQQPADRAEDQEDYLKKIREEARGDCDEVKIEKQKLTKTNQAVMKGTEGRHQEQSLCGSCKGILALLIGCVTPDSSHFNQAMLRNAPDDAKNAFLDVTHPAERRQRQHELMKGHEMLAMMWKFKTSDLVFNK